MTVISSLFSGISGIISNGSALSVVGDNIANMSTPAFKSSIAVFENALSQRIGEAEVGLGSRLATTTANFTQGAFASSTRPTDLAIQGKGFFVVKSAAGDTFYTRAGIFEKNNNGEIVTSAGNYILQGYAIDATTGVVDTGSLNPINLSNISSAPIATTEVDFSMNLDAGATAQASFDGSTFALAQASSNFSVSTTVYDSLGNARSVTTYFNRTAANTWQYHTLTLGTNLNNYETADGADGTVIIAEGTLVFGTDGSLSTVTVNTVGEETATGSTTDIGAGELITPSAAFGIQWDGAAVQASITHDFGQQTGSTASTTQYASASSVSNLTPDGRASGVLQTFEIAKDGTITGNFSNGTSRDLFQIPLSIFANEEGLNRVGANLYAESNNSGIPQTGIAQDGGRGDVQSFLIEQSNVDLATEFVKIITYQRAFQASSRTVSTAAELLQDLVQLGR